MSRRQIQETVLLLIIAAGAAVGIETLTAGTPLRIAAGVALSLALPWIGASRLAAIRQGRTVGSRLSTSGALAFATLILLGLLLTTTTVGITTDRLVAGTMVVTGVLAVLGVAEERSSHPSMQWVRSPLGLALTVVAVAVSVFAFTLARNRALSQTHQETSYSAFLVAGGHWLSVGLNNPTSHEARFTVRKQRRHSGSAITVAVPPHRTQIVPSVVPKPPPLRPIQRLTPRRDNPVNIRISVSVGEQARKHQLELSTFAP